MQEQVWAFEKLPIWIVEYALKSKDDYLPQTYRLSGFIGIISLIVQILYHKLGVSFEWLE